MSLSTVFLGCTDLEEVPDGLLSPESFFQSESDFDSASLGVYRSLFGGWGNFSFNHSFLISGGADDVGTRPSDVSKFQYDSFRTNPAGGSHTSLWRSLYEAIGNANSIVTNIDRLDGVVSAERKGELEGQARYLRALSYFYLVRWFGEVPIITSENQKDAATVGQSPVSDIYNAIVADLQIAETILPVSYVTEKARATRGAAKAILAKVYLTMAGWPLEDTSNYALARDKANEVITSGTYSLESDFADLWKVSNKLSSSEWIFSFQGSAGAPNDSGSKHHHATRPGPEGGWNDWFSEARFFNEFPDGYRKDISFHTVFADGTLWQDGDFGQPYIAKFRDAGSPCAGDVSPCNGGNGDFITPVIRYADVLLIYAEAANMAEGSPSSTAYERINMVRRRANNQNANVADVTVDLAPGMSQADFDDAVIAERAWELAFENIRWFDLVRKKMVVEVNSSTFSNVTADNRLLPKPASEVELIDGLEQNDGY